MKVATIDILLDLQTLVRPSTPAAALVDELIKREHRRLRLCARGGSVKGSSKARTREQAQAAIDARWKPEPAPLPRRRRVIE